MTRRDLTRKYTALMHKYEALVAQMVHARGERSWASHLGGWALRGTSAALAVVEGGDVVIQNANWLHLSHVRAWRSFAGEEPARRYDTLAQLTRGEAARLKQSRQGTSSVRFIREDAAQVIKLRLERVPEGRRVVVLIDDITRDEAELQALRDAVAHQDRLRMLGEISAGVVHDLGNALRGMAMRIAAVREVAPKPLQVHLQALAEALRRCQETLTRGRNLVQPGGAHSDVRAIFDDIAELMRISDKAVTLRIHGGPVGLVRGSGVELRHLFLNLVLNARDSMGGQGVVEVTLTRVARRARIEVRDHGPGFAADVLPRIFEPFFTTKAGGMGLGLSLARSLVTSLGGTIRAENAGGARITVELPLTSNRKAAPSANADRSRQSASAASPGHAPRRKRRARLARS